MIIYKFDNLQFLSSSPASHTSWPFASLMMMGTSLDTYIPTCSLALQSQFLSALTTNKIRHRLERWVRVKLMVSGREGFTGCKGDLFFQFQSQSCWCFLTVKLLKQSYSCWFWPRCLSDPLNVLALILEDEVKDKMRKKNRNKMGVLWIKASPLRCHDVVCPVLQWLCQAAVLAV